jgi:hypothetical protein
MKVIHSIDNEKCICECAIQENGRKKNEKEKNREDFSARAFSLSFFFFPLHSFSVSFINRKEKEKK